MARRHAEVVVRAWMQGRISRRELIRRLALMGISLPTISALIAACGGDAESPAANGGGSSNETNGGEETPVEAVISLPDYIDKSKLAKSVHLFNWSEYTDPEALALFEQVYGVEVIEDSFASNEDLLAKLQGGASGYDVIFPSDYMVSVMIELDLLEPLDFDVIRTIENIDPANLSAYYDPENKYSMPYMWGTTGYLYNADVIEDELDSWDHLFNPPEAAQGRVAMLDDQREVIGAALMYLGYSVNETSDEALAEAKEVLLQQRPHVKAYSSQNNDDMMLSGEAVLAHMWTGDALLTADEGEGMKYVLPKEGCVIWQDTMAVPKGAPNLYTAMAFIDFMNLPEIAAMNSNMVWYPSPNLAAREQELIEDWMLDDPAIYPPPEVMERFQWIEDVGDDITKYDRIWTEFKSA